MPSIEKSREEHIIRWANYVKTNPSWKKQHTAFINAQFVKHNAFIKRLLKQPDGKEKYNMLKEMISKS